MFQKLLLCLLCTVLASNIYAQSAVPNNEDNVLDLSFLSENGMLSEKIFFTDPDNKVYYIDFEATKTKITQIQLWKNEEELVKNENTLELPENTIYELKIEDLPAGSYSIELTTVDDDAIIQIFNVTTNKGVTVKKDKK